MIKNAKVKDLEHVILNVVEKNNSSLDLSEMQIDSVIPRNLFKKAAEESRKLALIRVNCLHDIISCIHPESSVSIIDNNEKIKELNLSNFTNINTLSAEAFDLRTDLCMIENYLKKSPTNSLQEYKLLQAIVEEQKNKNPLVPDNSFDTIILDTNLNTLEDHLFTMALEEAFRSLEKGGKIVLRIFISDEPCNDLLPISIKGFELKTVPIEKEIFDIMDRIGFHGMTFEWRSELPVKVINRIEFREFVISAYKGKQGSCLDCGQAVMYRGPWKEVIDDDGHHFIRGERTAVCVKTYGLMNREPYKGQFIYIPCYAEIPEETAPMFDCNTPKVRNIQVSKGIIDVKESNADNGNSSCGCDCGC